MSQTVPPPPPKKINYIITLDYIVRPNFKARKGKEMFYLTTHSTHFIYGYMPSEILLRTILIVRKETRCHHIGYSFRLTARVLLYAPSHRQDSTYHSLCYTSRGALAGTRNSSMGPPWKINPTTTELHLAPNFKASPITTNVIYNLIALYN